MSAETLAAGVRAGIDAIVVHPVNIDDALLSRLQP